MAPSGVRSLGREHLIRCSDQLRSEVLSQLAPLLQFDSMSRFSLFAVVPSHSHSMPWKGPCYAYPGFQVLKVGLFCMLTSLDVNSALTLLVHMFGGFGKLFLGLP